MRVCVMCVCVLSACYVRVSVRVLGVCLHEREESLDCDCLRAFVCECVLTMCVCLRDGFCTFVCACFVPCLFLSVCACLSVVCG